MNKKILFVCTGNSCRSQMAEGLLKHYSGQTCEAFSAGTNPTSINPNAILVMKELDIDISKQKSESIDNYLNQRFDVVITVCDNAKETCPVFTGKVKKRLHWSFRDPAEAEGNQDEILDVFRKIRDEIKQKIIDEFAG